MRSKAVQVPEQNLREAVSDLLEEYKWLEEYKRLEDYQWAIKRAKNLFDLRAIERRLMTDTKLTANERGQLFAITAKRRPLGRISFHTLKELR